jgi:hypothetical protein
VIYPRARFQNIDYPEELAQIKDINVYFPRFKGDKADFGEYRRKLQNIQEKEMIELILLSELLSVSLIRNDKTKTLEQARIALGINSVLILMGIFLFLILLL